MSDCAVGLALFQQRDRSPSTLLQLIRASLWSHTKNNTTDLK